MSDAETAAQPHATVVVYSSNSVMRSQVVQALGRRPSADLPLVRVQECATAAAVLAHLKAHTPDLLVMDGEAQPTGGLGLCRQLKDEVFECPPVLVLVAREQDRWLGAWAQAEQVLVQPVDPMSLAQAAAQLLRQRLAESAGSAEVGAVAAG